MRSRALALTVVLALAGCAAGPTDDAYDRPPPLPPVQLVDVPAASAGGACILWNFPFLEAKLGVLFDVAAAGRVDNTSTCVVQSAGAARPDLALSVVEETEADVAVFVRDLTPAGASRVKKLGRAAYRLVSQPGADHGPVIEIGWLSVDKQLMTLKFTFAEGASRADADAMTDRMIALARNLNGDDIA